MFDFKSSLALNGFVVLTYITFSYIIQCVQNLQFSQLNKNYIHIIIFGIQKIFTFFIYLIGI